MGDWLYHTKDMAVLRSTDNEGKNFISWNPQLAPVKFYLSEFT